MSVSLALTAVFKRIMKKTQSSLDRFNSGGESSGRDVQESESEIDSTIREIVREEIDVALAERDLDEIENELDAIRERRRVDSQHGQRVSGSDRSRDRDR